MSKRYMGFDISLTCSGMSIVIGDAHETFKLKPPPSVGTGIARLDFMYRGFRDFIQEHGRPELAFVEDYAMGAKGQVFNIGEGGAAFRLAMLHERVPLMMVSPNSLKKFVTGVGSGGKEVVIMKLLRNFGVEIESNDEADAFALGKMAQFFDYHINGIGTCPANCGHKYQVEAIMAAKVAIKKPPKRR